MAEETQKPEQELLQGVNPALSPNKLYFNGFTITASPSDVVFTLQLDGQPFVSLYTSYIIADTLVQKLLGLLGSLHGAGLPLLNQDEVLALLSKAGGVNEPQQHSDQQQRQSEAAGDTPEG